MIKEACNCYTFKNAYLATILSRTEIESKLKEIKPILIDRFYVNEIGYFGSYANNQQTEKSDLDLIVGFSQPIGWTFFTLENF